MRFALSQRNTFRKHRTMKHRSMTLARSAQRALKLSLRQAESALLESLDAFDYSHEIDSREIDSLVAHRDTRDAMSDDSRAFFHDIELAHAHSRKIAF
jgi:hypothetical protein